MVSVIADWIAGDRTLLCVDAPLGWPAAFDGLARHQAGEKVRTPRESTFNRETDRVVESVIKKPALRVGADRIAMTAHWAVELLDALRRVSGLPIPLAWAPNLGDLRSGCNRGVSSGNAEDPGRAVHWLQRSV